MLYKNEKFALYSDRVVQGEHVAKVVSPVEIHSDYKSPAPEYSNILSFKFTINGKDIELPSGKEHHVKVLKGDHQSPLFVFGVADKQLPEDTGQKLGTNHSYTFRADMRPVLEQFRKKGFYEAFDGSRILKAFF